MTRIFSFAVACILLFGSLAVPFLTTAEGLLLQPGNVVNFEVTSMTVASDLLTPGGLVESYGYVGSVSFPDFSTTRRLRAAIRDSAIASEAAVSGPLVPLALMNPLVANSAR